MLSELTTNKVVIKIVSRSMVFCRYMCFCFFRQWTGSHGMLLKLALDIHKPSICILWLEDGNLYLCLRTMSHTIYAAKFEQTIIHQHVHLWRESQSHAPAHVLMRLCPIDKSFVCLTKRQKDVVLEFEIKNSNKVIVPYNNWWKRRNIHLIFYCGFKWIVF